MTTHQQTSQAKQDNTGARQPANHSSLIQTPMIYPSILRQVLENPQAARPEAILQLQRLYGNRAMRQIFTSANQRNDPDSSISATPAMVKVEPETNHIRRRMKPSRNIIQRAIVISDLNFAILSGEFSELKSDALDKERRDREETKMLYEELQLRYKDKIPKNLVIKVVGKLNEGDKSNNNKLDNGDQKNKNEVAKINTLRAIRQTITQVEKDLGLQSTEPQPSPNRLIRLLTERRGAYRWKPGHSFIFIDWINQTNPLQNPLPENTIINCWEAVLAVAAQAELVSIGELKKAYLQENVQNGVFEMLSRKGVVKEIKHSFDPPGDNGIRVGDVIMLEGVGEKLHHVVIALTENPKDYTAVEVMSLWNIIGGGGFTKTTLGECLIPTITIIRYVSLK